MLEKALWVVQVILAIKFVATAYSHAFAAPGSRWQCPLEEMGPRAGLVLRVSALFCVLGALGLILPGVTHILPWLTPLAAGLLALLMARGIVFHVRCRDRPNVVAGVVLAGMALFVAVGRGWLAPL